jgi:hypothetical protein
MAMPLPLRHGDRPLRTTPFRNGAALIVRAQTEIHEICRHGRTRPQRRRSDVSGPPFASGSMLLWDLRRLDWPTQRGPEGSREFLTAVIAANFDAQQQTPDQAIAAATAVHPMRAASWANHLARSLCIRPPDDAENSAGPAKLASILRCDLQADRALHPNWRDNPCAVRSSRTRTRLPCLRLDRHGGDVNSRILPDRHADRRTVRL